MNLLSPVAISGKLLNWYEKNQRDLPWRSTRNPYIIWLSEIILQQTRVEQGLPYFYRFLDRFPTIHYLAESSENEVLKLWQGLGYYTRARNLHATAKSIANERNGQFPGDYKSIRELKGVGDYTAAAIASFAYGEPVPVVDGNVYRFLSRYFGEFTPVDSSQGKKVFNTLAATILNIKQPGMHNQAVMEFGSLQCKPLNPDCVNCPLNKSCLAFNNDQVQQLPVKSKKQPVKERHFNYLLVHYRKNIFLNKRSPGDIWAQLYELPLIETERKISVEKLMVSESWKKYFHSSGTDIRKDKEFRVHKLSHQHIHSRIVEIILKREPKKLFVSSFISVKPDALHKYPVSRLTEILLNDSLNNLKVSSP